MEKKQSISKGQFITWIITVLIFITGAMAAVYSNIDSQIRALELDVNTFKMKYEQHDRYIQEAIADIKEIKKTTNEIDKKLYICTK